MKNLFSASVLALVLQLLTSCEFDSSGNSHLTTNGWLIIIAVIAFVVIGTIIDIVTRVKSSKKMEANGVSLDMFIRMDMYVGGHPMIDNQIKNSCIFKRGSDLVICDFDIISTSFDAQKFANEDCIIPINSIKNILVEDASTVESRITMGRMLLVGIFALAWKKRQKNGLAFVVIEWTQGRFEHSTIFSFEGNGAMLAANSQRNRLIRVIS